MQKCYNCGKEVDDNVLICPECGALVKRYGKPEPQQAEPFESQGTAFTQPPQPHAAVWQREDGKLKFSGGVTFWLVLCTIFFPNQMEIAYPIAIALGNLVDPPATMVNAAGDYAASFLVARITEGSGWLERTDGERTA